VAHMQVGGDQNRPTSALFPRRSPSQIQRRGIPSPGPRIQTPSTCCIHLTFIDQSTNSGGHRRSPLRHHMQQ
jgi:hypothetical protein